MYIKLHWYSKVKILGGSFKKIIKGKIVIMLKLRYRQKINVIK